MNQKVVMRLDNQGAESQLWPVLAQSRDVQNRMSEPVDTVQHLLVTSIPRYWYGTFRIWFTNFVIVGVLGTKYTYTLVCNNVCNQARYSKNVVKQLTR